MQTISIDLIRLVVLGAAVCAGELAGELGGLYHSDQIANAKTRVAPPIQVNAISVGAPSLCWAIEEPIDASATPGAQTERAAFAQSCSSVAPILRRLSEPQSRLALAP
jgi:hypothetical protein